MYVLLCPSEFSSGDSTISNSLHLGNSGLNHLETEEDRDYMKTLYPF